MKGPGWENENIETINKRWCIDVSLRLYNSSSYPVPHLHRDASRHHSSSVLGPFLGEIDLSSVSGTKTASSPTTARY